MSGGKVTGRELRAAFGRGTAWGTPVSVTRQILIASTDGMDAMPQIVDDEVIGHAFLQAGEVGDYTPPTPALGMVARYEDIDTWFAAAVGSPANPTAVSSQGAATSLVAYQHVVDMSPELTAFFTLAVDFPGHYVQEIPSLKVHGYSLRVGENGRMMVEFQTVGNKTTYDSTTNTNSTVHGARAAGLGNRLFRKNGTLRMNPQSAGALANTDIVSLAREIAFNGAEPVSSDDFVFGLDYVIEPDNNGFPEFSVEVTYARMTSQSANSLAVGLAVARVFKADWNFLGPYINSATQRQLKWEFPALQLRSFRAVASGPDQVRPQATFHAKLAATSPTGMAFVNPYRMTVVNMNSQNLLA
jgi:hypothetical protein